MKKIHLLLVELMAFAFAQMLAADPTNRYVAKDNPGALAPYDAWTNAAADIQTAINYAYAGETVWVSNGVFDAGGITNYPTGSVNTNRVTIYKAVTVRSVNNDPANTIIEGAWHPVTTNGPAAVRCVYMTNGSALIGFTLTNGATPATDGDAGGIYCEATNNTVISNCVIIGNAASRDGGGTRLGTLYNCEITRNSAYRYGGGSLAGTLYNCTLISNSVGTIAGSSVGGGNAFGYLYNCTLIGNTAGYGGGASGYLYNCLLFRNTGGEGGGARNSILYSCTIVSNVSAYADGGGVSIGTVVNCISWDNNRVDNPTAYFSCGAGNSYTNVNNGNITNDPRFADSANSNYRIRSDSPCLNTGTNESWMTNSFDLDGRGRIRYGRVDMGAYELIYEGSLYYIR